MLDSTLYIYGYMVSDIVKDHSAGENTLYLWLYGVGYSKGPFSWWEHYIYGYMASDIVKDHSAGENTLYLWLYGVWYSKGPFSWWEHFIFMAIWRQI